MITPGHPSFYLRATDLLCYHKCIQLGCCMQAYSLRLRQPRPHNHGTPASVGLCGGSSAEYNDCHVNRSNITSSRHCIVYIG
jgi:hypothetical protein